MASRSWTESSSSLDRLLRALASLKPESLNVQVLAMMILSRSRGTGGAVVTGCAWSGVWTRVGGTILDGAACAASFTINYG